jgi:hypothetical protein
MAAAARTILVVLVTLTAEMVAKATAMRLQSVESLPLQSILTVRLMSAAGRIFIRGRKEN